MKPRRIFSIFIFLLCFCSITVAKASDEPAVGPCDRVDVSPLHFWNPRSNSIFENVNRNPARIWVYGWLQTGIMANEYGNKNGYGSPYVSPVHRQLEGISGNSYLLMMEQQSDFKLNQLWLGVQRKLETRRGFDWGFQVDMAYGTDLRYCQAFNDKTFDFDWGSGDYYLSIPTLYGEIGCKKWALRVGKFDSGMSHESYAAPEMFFYSNS